MDKVTIKAQPNYADFETETAFVSEAKFAVITIDGGMDKVTAFRRAFCRGRSIILRLLYKSG